MFYIHFYFLKMSESLIPSFLMSDVSESLRSLTKNERPWAICTGHSEEMSDHERITQVAHQNWANEQIACFLSESFIWSFFRKNEGFAQKADERIPGPDYKWV